MHIPDGYLSPQTYIPLYGASVLFWSIGLKKARKHLSDKEVPYLAMAAAFSFLVQMFNIPIPGGSTGHAVGGAITTLLLGPWIAVIAISLVIIVQAFVFGDGGITAIGANSFNMAVVMPFVSFGVFRLVRGRSTKGKRILVAAFLSGYIGLSAAAVCTGIEFGVQTIIAHGPDGRPLYAPYPLSVAVPVMAIEHLALFGIVEGFLTLLLFRYLMAHQPGLVYAMKGA
jgi:cobalt/nickel transport system permease protein